MKNTFIQTNDRIVNLQNVSNINIIPGSRRIVFNLNYAIEIVKNNNYKYISDYVYWDLIDDNNFEYAKGLLYANDYIKDFFVQHRNGYINSEEISTVKFSDKKKRVIFNLSHPVTYVDYDGYTRITSEFVYVDYKDYTEYTKYRDTIKTKLLKER